jgi:hypothetical protein
MAEVVEWAPLYTPEPEEVPRTWFTNPDVTSDTPDWNGLFELVWRPCACGCGKIHRSYVPTHDGEFINITSPMEA